MKTLCAGCGVPTPPEGYPGDPRRRDGRGETCLRCCVHRSAVLSRPGERGPLAHGGPPPERQPLNHPEDLVIHDLINAQRVALAALSGLLRDQVTP